MRGVGAQSPVGDTERPRLTVQRPLSGSEDPCGEGGNYFMPPRHSVAHCLELKCNFTVSNKYLHFEKGGQKCNCHRAAILTASSSTFMIRMPPAITNQSFKEHFADSAEI